MSYQKSRIWRLGRLVSARVGESLSAVSMPLPRSIAITHLDCTVLAKRSRGYAAAGFFSSTPCRDFDLWVVLPDGAERFVQFTRTEAGDIEARSGDNMTLTYADGALAVIANHASGDSYSIETAPT